VVAAQVKVGEHSEFLYESGYETCNVGRIGEENKWRGGPREEKLEEEEGEGEGEGRREMGERTEKIRKGVGGGDKSVSRR